MGRPRKEKDKILQKKNKLNKTRRKVFNKDKYAKRIEKSIHSVDNSKSDNFLFYFSLIFHVVLFLTGLYFLYQNPKEYIYSLFTISSFELPDLTNADFYNLLGLNIMLFFTGYILIKKAIISFGKGKASFGFTSRGEYRILFFSVFLVLLFVSIGYSFSENLTMAENTLGFLLFLMLVVHLIILFTYLRPKLLLNRFFALIGYYIYSFISTTVIVIIFQLLDPNYFPPPFLILLFVLNHLLLIPLVFERINIIQIAAIRLMNPNKALYAIKTKISDISTKKRALLEVERRIKNNDFQYLKSMDEIINEELKPSVSISKKVFNFVITGIGLFILQSLGEGIVQDLLLNDLKVTLCKILNILCD